MYPKLASVLLIALTACAADTYVEPGDTVPIALDCGEVSTEDLTDAMHAWEAVDIHFTQTGEPRARIVGVDRENGTWVASTEDGTVTVYLPTWRATSADRRAGYIAHELGHVLGLSHVPDEAGHALMNPSANMARPELLPPDHAEFDLRGPASFLLE